MPRTITDLGHGNTLEEDGTGVKRYRIKPKPNGKGSAERGRNWRQGYDAIDWSLAREWADERRVGKAK